MLEKFKFDFNSDEPLDLQELDGNRKLRKYCLERIESAQLEREARVEDAKNVYQAQMQEEEELRIKVSHLLKICPNSRVQYCNITMAFACINRRKNVLGLKGRKRLPSRRSWRRLNLRRRKLQRRRLQSSNVSVSLKRCEPRASKCKRR